MSKRKQKQLGAVELVKRALRIGGALRFVDDTEKAELWVSNGHIALLAGADTALARATWPDAAPAGAAVLGELGRDHVRCVATDDAKILAYDDAVARKFAGDGVTVYLDRRYEMILRAFGCDEYTTNGSAVCGFRNAELVAFAMGVRV